MNDFKEWGAILKEAHINAMRRRATIGEQVFKEMFTDNKPKLLEVK